MKVLSKDTELDELSRDSGIISIKPRVAYVAYSEEEVISVIENAIGSGESVTPRGAGTSIPSQSIGGGSILLQGRKRAELIPGNRVTCEPALVKGELNEILERAGRWMPVDPSSYLSCTVGGMVANNSSGIRTPRYGSTIRYVEALEAIIPSLGLRTLRPSTVEEALSGDGPTRTVAEAIVENQKTIADEQPHVSKNSSGYRLENVVHDGLFDLAKLMVGSEGTLGVFTEVTFSTLPRQESRVLLIVEAALDELDKIVSEFKKHDPTAIELVDKSIFKKTGREDRISKYSRSGDEYMLFCELEGSEESLLGKLDIVAGSKAAGFEPLVLSTPSDVREAWEVRNESLTLALEIKEEGKILVPGVEDLVAPPDRLGDLVKLLKDEFEGRGLEYISYGHASDANLHSRPLLDPTIPSGRRVLEELMEESFEAIWRMGGSITGEHGDGMLRAPYVAKQYPKTYDLMRRIRNSFDPKGILNPGVKIV